MKIVIFGLTISSSWGNGHATLWRGLCRARRAAPPFGRSPGRTALWGRRSRGPPPGARRGPLSLRPFLSRHLFRRSSKRALGVDGRAGKASPASTLPHRRRAVPTRLSLAPEYLFRSPPASDRASRFLLLVTTDAQRDA